VNLKIIFSSLLLFLVLIIISGCDSSSTPATPKKVCNDVQVPYEAQEEYIDQEPYETVECHQEKLTFTKNIGQCDTQIGWLGLGSANMYCSVTNTDAEAGTFSVKVGFTCGNKKWHCYSAERDHYLLPKYSEKFEGNYKPGTEDFEVNGCFCEVISPTKQICNNVIKYRDVIKYRTVTKYRTEQKCE